MKVTNKHNLPERITRMLHLNKEMPNPQRMSVTSLIDAPRIRTLLIEKFNDIVYDVSDYLSTIIGISVHQHSENTATKEEDVEHKLEDDKDMKGIPFGITLVGKADNYIEPLIIDTKVKAVGFKNFGYKEIEEQLNIYAWQRRNRFQPVDKLIADIIYRDWKLRETVKNEYPQILYEQLDIPLWTFEQQNDYILSRLKIHKEQPLLCPDEARWKTKDKWAVKKKGKQRAERVLDTEAEANEWMKKNRGDYVEHRVGRCIRCDDYCPVRSVCEFSACYGSPQC